MKMPAATHREIILLPPDLPPTDMRRIAGAFNRRFANDDVHIACKNGGVTVQLRELDMRQMRRVIKEIGGTHGKPADFFWTV